MGLSVASCGGLIELDSEVTSGGGGAATTGAGGGTGGAGPASGGTTATGGGTTATGGITSAGGTTEVPDGVLLTADPAAYCASVCAQSIANSCMGCEPTFCPEEAANWDVPVRGAFAACAASEPLCFRSPEACMLDVLFPPDTPTRYHVLQISFLEGEPPYHVRAGAMGSGGPVDITAQTVSLEDHLVFEWEHGWDSDIGPTFYVWVDQDRDGLCESGDDRFGVGSASWNGSFHPPYYFAEVTFYLASGVIACPVLGFNDSGAK